PSCEASSIPFSSLAARPATVNLTSIPVPTRNMWSARDTKRRASTTDGRQKHLLARFCLSFLTRCIASNRFINMGLHEQVHTDTSRRLRQKLWHVVWKSAQNLQKGLCSLVRYSSIRPM